MKVIKETESFRSTIYTNQKSKRAYRDSIFIITNSNVIYYGLTYSII